MVKSRRVKTFSLDTVFFVRPAGRTHLEVKVLYRPGSGNC